MRAPSSALDQILAFAKSAREMWSMDTGEWEIRKRTRARTVQSSPFRKITLQFRRQGWGGWVRSAAFSVGVVMIAVAFGFALRGEVPTMVGSAGAAAPAVAPLSRITVTPIEEPMSTITVTPIEEPLKEPTPLETVAAAPAALIGTGQTSHASKPVRRAKARKIAKAARGKTTAAAATAMGQATQLRATKPKPSRATKKAR